MTEKRTTAVIGDGWAALGAAGLLAQAGNDVVWITASGARCVPPLPTLEAGPGVAIWAQLATRLGIPLGDAETGSFLREFRNKAFREPAWTKAPTPGDRRNVRDEMLWEAERSIAPAFEARFESDAGELEALIRAAVHALPGIRRIEGVPLKGFQFENGKIKAVVLGSGEAVPADRVIYADRWPLLAGLEGLPKGLPFLRKREPSGLLQATFAHRAPIGAGLKEGFFGAVHKEAGEETQRHVWGYFTGNGERSVWSFVVAANESEDNHEIAKRLRRMKQTLDRMFTGAEWLGAAGTEFMSTVVGEQVRFEEELVLAGGEVPAEATALPDLEGLWFVTDGYGPSAALQQIGLLLREELGLQPAESVAEKASAESAPAAPVVS